jgi:hypothetical protein
MHACTKTPTNISSQLHRRLEGKAISVGDIPKLDTASKYLFQWKHCTKFSEAFEDCHPLDTSFLIWGGLFPPPIGIENVLTTSLKTLDDHLFQLNKFA